MNAYLFPMDGAWMLKVATVGYYVDSKQEGIDLCQQLALELPITTLTIADINNGFRHSDDIDEQ